MKSDCEDGVYHPRSKIPVNGHNATGDHLLQVAITGASTNLTVQLPLIAPRAGIVYAIYRIINPGKKNIFMNLVN